MPDQIEIRIPDIGDFEDVEIVEILVGPGDRVEVDEPIISIESDKATMEVPSPVAGEILELRVSLGDSVSEGTVLALVAVEEAGEASPESAPPPEPDTLEEESPAEVEAAEEPAETLGAPEPIEEGAPSEPSAVVRAEEQEDRPPTADGTAPHAGPGGPDASRGNWGWTSTRLPEAALTVAFFEVTSRPTSSRSCSPVREGGAPAREFRLCPRLISHNSGRWRTFRFRGSGERRRPICRAVGSMRRM